MKIFPNGLTLFSRHNIFIYIYIYIYININRFIEVYIVAGLLNKIIMNFPFDILFGIMRKDFFFLNYKIFQNSEKIEKIKYSVIFRKIALSDFRSYGF